ncbi:uncharacterized protein BO97DRAFT_404334 [Aspergillus homomorphus CBS 101889]|uniref:Uncharacterized protein n=1 Tax=Aspergillus homomorphus (strain CBS 101889) TaxID=1450537 RepID=A0A395I2Y0_ASPHC|nr:hypothetical protein BO97DRAFT_404334 [Aspergillus homomorphus CBS 101889]RAL14420.1 hypothetical protein BO97DRAFT_404334 [Aspergillus homomorphus CBS 101889]
MEAAPLTLAHTHARNAVIETRKSNPVAASEEHDLAAGEFATAAQHSSDREALRTLQLLEQHHKKLAQILRFQHENPSNFASTQANTQPLSAETGGSTRTSTAGADAQQQPPRLSRHPRLPSRESSSIVSNLASARGIPSQPRRSSPASPTLTSQQAGAKMTDGPAKVRTSESRLRGVQAHGMKERASRPSTSRQSRTPPLASPTEITSQQFAPPTSSEASHQRSRTSMTEEPFQKFYSTFEGLISKISAPLAFAGLPLGSEASEASAHRKSAPDTRTDRYNAMSDRSHHSADPDINKIFSKAALQAIRDTSGTGPTGNPAESFYVVPTTGGTVSYAGILTRAEKEARRSSFDEGDEDFVDARETPSSPELRQSLSGMQGISKAGRGNDKFSSPQNPKTMEELQMENQVLRQLSDNLSKRLHMWEVNAQSSSMALQQSLKAMHHPNALSPDHPAPSSSAAMSPVVEASASPAAEHEKRIKELEEAVRRSEEAMGEIGRENEKLRAYSERLRDKNEQYRDRWEKLKEGARRKRAPEGSAANGGTAAVPQPSRNPSSQGDEATRTKAEGEVDNDTISDEAETKAEGPNDGENQ